MGELTKLEIGLGLVVLILGTLAAALAYERHKGYVQCEAAQHQADVAQHARDAKINQDLTDENKRFKDQLVAAGSVATAPVPDLRLCVSTRSVRSQPPAPGARPVTAPAVGHDQGVPSGAPAAASVDLGPTVQDLALAGLLRAANGDLLWERAVKEAEKH